MTPSTTTGGRAATASGFEHRQHRWLGTLGSALDGRLDRLQADYLAGVEELPALVERPFEILGAATLPLTMIYAGLMLDLRGVERLWRELGYVVVVRLGLSTLLGVAVAAALRLEGDVRATVVIMAAMPTAMMSLVIGTRSGLRSDVLASAVVVTTLLSTLTLPALRAVLL